MEIVGPCSKRERILFDDDKASLLSNLRQIKECCYYWGPLDGPSAEAALEGQPDGSFLLRDSSDDRHFFTMSFQAQLRTRHARIAYADGLFSFGGDHAALCGHSSIIDLIEDTMQQSKAGHYRYFLRSRLPGEHPVPVRVLYPLRRDRHVFTLRHLCRFAIVTRVRRDHIDNLPLPRDLLLYLKDGQYYYEQHHLPHHPVHQPSSAAGS